MTTTNRDATNTLRTSKNRIFAIERAMNQVPTNQITRTTRPQQQFVKIKAVLTSQTYTAVFIEWNYGTADAIEVSDEFTFRAPNFPSGFFSLNEIVPVAEHANEIIPNLGTKQLGTVKVTFVADFSESDATVECTVTKSDIESVSGTITANNDLNLESDLGFVGYCHVFADGTIDLIAARCPAGT